MAPCTLYSKLRWTVRPTRAPTPSSIGMLACATCSSPDTGQRKVTRTVRPVVSIRLMREEMLLQSL
jgi:hypothetical protein